MAMASDHQQYDRMTAHYDMLRADNALSVAPDVGRLAIVTMYPEDIEARRPEDSFRAIDSEARRLQNMQEAAGKATIYAPRASVGNFREILDDRTISDITLIGLGQLSKVQLAPWCREADDPTRPSEPQPVLSYFDAISTDGRHPTITHLKQGSFHQRTSGQMPAPINIPFAWGFMADRSKIWGSPQQAFYPKKNDTQLTDGLTNLAEHFGLSAHDLAEPIDYRTAKALFGTREALGRSAPRYPVPPNLLPIYDRLRDSSRVRGLHETIRKGLRAAGIAEF
jgi:hypothetical protein